MSTKYNPSVVSDNLLLYLDAGNVKSYAGIGVTWTDMSRRENNGSNGTGTDACSFESSEPKCFVFDASNNNGRILMPKIFYGNNHGSLEVWFQHNQSTSTAAGPGMIFFEGNLNGFGPETEFHLSVNNSGNVSVFVEGANDDISAPGQCKAALNLLKNLPKNMKRYHLQKKAGHYGIFSGKAWRSHIRPKFLEFIDNRYS